MLTYSSGGKYFILNLFRCSGSVFPKTMLIGLLCAAVSSMLNILYPDYSLNRGILYEPQAWAGFSFLLGFLVVFRTQQAHSRFWEGCTCAHRMRAEWFDAVSSVIAFTKYSSNGEAELMHFRELLIRLVSMLHASALAELEAGDSDDPNELWAHTYDIIDPDSLDEDSLATIQDSKMRVELLFHWIQELIVEQIDTGVMNIPAPILSRSFQELANGMVAFHDAMKIAYIPFPFPYAQACDGMLVLHWPLVAIITSQWVTTPLWAALFTFIQVFVLWSLNFVAIEIDKPFGKDPNDIDGDHMQKELNSQLWLLLEPGTLRTPTLINVPQFDTKSERPRSLRRKQTGSFEKILRRTLTGGSSSLVTERTSLGSDGATTWHEVQKRRSSRSSSSDVPSASEVPATRSISSEAANVSPGDVNGSRSQSRVSGLIDSCDNQAPQFRPGQRVRNKSTLREGVVVSVDADGDPKVHIDNEENPIQMIAKDMLPIGEGHHHASLISTFDEETYIGRDLDEGVRHTLIQFPSPQKFPPATERDDTVDNVPDRNVVV